MALVVQGRSGASREVGGRFVKDLIRPGKYSHPAGKWEETFTGERLSAIVAETQRAIANGVKPKVCADHRTTSDATLGQLADVFMLAGQVFGVADVGEDGQKQIANGNEVSVCVEKDWRDGHGNRYPEIITHVALTPDPIVTPQDPFVALSGDGETRAHGVLFSRALGETDDTGDGTMTIEELAAALGEALGVDGLKPEAAVAAVRERIAGHASALQAARETAAGTPSLPTLDPEAEGLLVEAAEAAIDGLVPLRLLPATAAKMKAALIGAEGKRCAFALSRKFAAGEHSLVADVVAALKDNDVVKLGGQTGTQTLTDDGKGTPKEPAIDDEMIEMAKGT